MAPPGRLTVAEAMAHAFAAEGTAVQFGLMGDGNMDFMVASREAAMQVFDVRHEAAAVAMADGHARATGGVGVATVTCGPGLTQVGTSLMTASRHGTPLVVLAGDTALVEKGMQGPGVQDMDQQAFAQASGALHHVLRSPDTVAADVRRAFLLARTRRTPVVLSAAVDLQEALAPASFAYEPSTALIADVGPLEPSARAVGLAVETIVAARRPVIVAGAGAMAAGAREALELLADQIGALLGTSLRAKGWFDDSPWSVSILGGFSLPLAEWAAEQADLVIAVGCSLAPQLTQGGRMFPRARLLRIDTDVTPAPGRPAADLLVRGDARVTAEAITDRLVQAGHRDAGYREDEELVERAKSDQREQDFADADWDIEPGTVDPRRFVMELDELLPRECHVVVGAGHFWSTVMAFLSGHRTRRFTSSYDFGAVGQGFPTALGIALGDPTVPVIAFEGDTSMLMHVQELDTVARYAPRLLTFVMNDQALGSEFHKLRIKGHDAAQGVVPTPSFAAVAAGFGVQGAEVRGPGEAASVVGDFVGGGGPCVVDVAVDRRVISRYYRRTQFGSPTAK